MLVARGRFGYLLQASASLTGATAAPGDPGGLGQGLEGEDGQGRYNLLEVSRKLVDHLSSIISPVPESRTFLQSISQSNLRVK